MQPVTTPGRTHGLVAVVVVCVHWHECVLVRYVTEEVEEEKERKLCSFLKFEKALPSDLLTSL